MDRLADLMADGCPTLAFASDDECDLCDSLPGSGIFSVAARGTSTQPFSSNTLYNRSKSAIRVGIASCYVIFGPRSTSGRKLAERSGSPSI